MHRVRVLLLVGYLAGMAIRKLAAIATACLVLPASATALRPGSVVRQGWAPARETSTAEQIDKSSTGVSPIPTSHPEFAAVDLFQRADYSLPSDYCGWYDEFKCEQMSFFARQTFSAGRMGGSFIRRFGQTLY